MMVDRVAARLAALSGWRRLIVACAAGALSTFALPPYHVIPLLWIAVPAFLWLLDGCARPGRAFATGWAFGFGHFGLGLSWITHAFFVDAETYGVLAWPAMAGLAVGMGLFFGAVAAGTSLIPPPSRDASSAIRLHRTAARALLLAAVWMLQEWVRNWILTGFPWNPIATVWAEDATPIGLAVLQSASVLGTFGLSLITLLAAALAAVLRVDRARHRWVWASAPLGALALIGALGAWRLAVHPTAMVTGVKFRLVQPNVPQAEKWRPELREAHLQDYVRLSTEGRPADVNVVVWGEDAVAYLFDRDAPHRAIAAEAAPANGYLITGGDRAESQDRIFNALYVIAPNADVIATYDKFHLVPFGEYMPLADILPFQQLTGGIGFSAGPGLRTLSVPRLPPFAPLICFEVIFPGHVIARGAPRPQWMLNLTNDSWFGTDTGPYQHFATARMRAIEEGVPLVRTANTGISAVVDSMGRVVAQLGLNHRGVLDAALPEAISSPPVFALFGNFTALAAATIISCAALVLYRRTR